MTIKQSRYYVREWRQIRRMTQQKLADMASISRQTVVMVERCAVTPSDETARKIAEVLQVTPAQLAKDPFARYAV